MIISKILNKIVYRFTPNCILNLIKLLSLTVINLIINQIKVKNTLNFTAVIIKYYYNYFHQLLFLKVKDYILL